MDVRFLNIERIGHVYDLIAHGAVKVVTSMTKFAERFSKAESSV